VASTERSITIWGQPNKSGIARLDASFDPNERCYFITPQSAELAIQQAKAKAVKRAGTAEAVETIANGSEVPEKWAEVETDPERKRFRELEKEVMDSTPEKPIEQMVVRLTFWCTFVVLAITILDRAGAPRRRRSCRP